MDNYLSLAEQLRILFETRTHPIEQRVYTNTEVSEGTGIGQATLSQMRRGGNKNPGLDTLRPLCRFFDIPLRYFETTSLDECYTILRGDAPLASEAAPVNEIALRASGLSPRSQRDILTLIKWAQAAEKLGYDVGLSPLLGLDEDDSELRE